MIPHVNGQIWKQAWVNKAVIGALAGGIGVLLVGLLSWQLPYGSQFELEEGGEPTMSSPLARSPTKARC